jgi:ADP-heptose:LPS heptosyltransferase
MKVAKKHFFSSLRRRCALLPIHWMIKAMIFFARFHRKTHLDPDSIRTILVVETLRMGDLLMTLASLPGLHALFPKAAIQMIVAKQWETLVQRSEDVSIWRTFPNKSVASIFALFRHLQKASFDLVVVPTPGSLNALLGLAASSRHRIGFFSAYSDAAPYLDAHQIFSYGMAPERAANVPPEARRYSYFQTILRLLGSSVPEIQKRLRTNINAADPPIIGIHGHAKQPYRSLPLPTLISFLSSMRKDFQERIQYFCHKDETAIQTALMSARLEGIEIITTDSIEETLNHIAGCSVFIGVDSGPLHLAEALDIPVIGVFGPTRLENYMTSDARYSQQIPVECNKELRRYCANYECPLEVPCMQRLDVSHVAKNTRILLDLIKQGHDDHRR